VFIYVKKQKKQLGNKIRLNYVFVNASLESMFEANHITSSWTI